MRRLTPRTLDAAAERRLRRHYLFAALTDAQWALLRAHVQRLQLAAGEGLFRQGESADAFFIVYSGGIKLYRESSRGLEKIMRLLKDGQSFAESVLFSEPPRYPVHAQAVSDSELFKVQREAYLALLRESFDTCRAVMAHTVQRIHAHWDEIEALSLHGSQARVARYLMELTPADAAAGARVRLPARKALIAGQLGLAPETLSRGLRALANRGVIAVHGRMVDVLDPAQLSRCASQ